MHHWLTQQVAAEHQRDLQRQADARSLQQQARRSRASTRLPLQYRLGWCLVELGLRLTMSRDSTLVALPESHRRQSRPRQDEVRPTNRVTQPSRQPCCPCQ